MLRAAVFTSMSILSTAVFLFSVPTLAAKVDPDEALPLILELFATHQECLKKNGFGFEPSVMIDETADLQAGINTLRAMESDGLKDFYELTIGGGFLNDTTMIEFLSVVAHELGHLAGGGPRNDSQNSVGEGEADYQSGRLLLPFILTKPELLKVVIDPALESAIAMEFALSPDDLTTLAKIKILAASYRSLMKFSQVKIELRKPFIGKPVRKTLEDYPITQERWNTIVAGLLDAPRPLSWANPADFKDSCSNVLGGGTRF